MKLTQKQIQKLQQTLLAAKACPNCGCTDCKIIDPNCYQLISHDIKEGNLDFEGIMPYQPLITVRCSKCSFTSLFNLKMLGIL